MSDMQNAPVFQLTPSRRATEPRNWVLLSFSFQLTPSRRATHFEEVKQDYERISTHALTEGDPKAPIYAQYIDISTHALTEGDRKFEKNLR